MIKKILKKILEKSGKDYTPDKSLPNKLILSIFYRRGFMLLRGYFKTGRKIFIGKSTRLHNAGNFKFGTGCTLEDHVDFDCFSKNKITFGNNVKISSFSIISVTSHLSKYGIGLKIGNNSAIGAYSYFGCSGGVEIGEDVIMGEYISLHSENHNFQDASKLIREQGVTSKGIRIGNNIWVGAKVTFLDGCSVGNNTVVAAGAVVKDCFPPNVVIGGVPAKILKKM